MTQGSQTNKVVLIIGIYLLLFAFQIPLRTGLNFALAPMQKLLFSAGLGVRGYFTYLSNISNFQKENGHLKMEIVDLKQQLAEQQELGRENQRLKELLSLNIEKKYNFILAKTITLSASSDLLQINKGESNGVIIGMAVIDSYNEIVGRVSNVYPTYSEVLLLGSPLMPIFDAKVATSGLEVLVKGQKPGQMLLEFAPSDKEFKEGDVLVSTLTGGVFPEGFVVGKISKVERHDTDPVPIVEVKSSYTFQQSDSIFLIAPK